MKPVLFTLPGLGWEIQAYGFFVALALVVAWAQTLRLSRAEGFDPKAMGPVFVASAAAGLLGARAAWVVQHPQAYEGVASLMTLRAGTMAPFAGTTVALIVGGAWVSRMKVRPWAWYDVLAPALALGLVFERLGAFFAGTAFGRYAADSPLSVRFPVGSPAFTEHRRTLANLMRSGTLESLAVHPVQLYAAALGLLGLVLCVWVRTRRQFEGQVFLSFGMFYLVVRAFAEEPLRADAPAGVLGPLNTGQVGAAAMLVVLAVVYAVLQRRGIQAPVKKTTRGRSRKTKRKR
ncbi:MAG: prolipoprotein diacylglyceryl transferase [Nannocystaceae bacterium]|nr:prolipoprotein diacylglyceryl transferase [Nannocystaceae bacterium]